MLTQSKYFNSNYATRIVEVTNVSNHPNADKLKLLHVDGNTIITGVDTKVGDYVVYFPLESSLSSSYLSYSNSYEDKSLNANTEAKGFFNKQGRVRAVKLRGAPSMGYCVPVKGFFEWISKEVGETIEFSHSHVDVEFDQISHNKKNYFVSKKHVNMVEKARDKREKQMLSSKYKAQQQSKLVEDQFRLHCDTVPLAKNIHLVNPDDLISITAKLHGTSGCFSRVLVRKQLKWYEKLLIKCGINLVTTMYDNLYSSRKVIKNRHYNDKDITDGYYGTDIWGVVNEEVKNSLPDGMTLYGEIVGFTTDGKAIQKGYDYGCKPSEHKFFVYRITNTNTAGKVIEFSTPQIIEWCKNKGLNYVPLYYHGYAKDLFNIPTDNHWHQKFLESLKARYLEGNDKLCKTKVPDEGICLRKENLIFDITKLKSFKFFEWESKALDSGEVDMESEESVSDS